MASPDLINRRDCSRCHDYGRAEEIKSAIFETDRKIAELERSLTDLHRTGIITQDMSAELFSVRNRFHRLFHSVDVEKVRSRSAGFQGELGKILDRVGAIEADLSRRKFWGGIVVVLLVCWGILGLLIFKSYRDERK